MKPISKEDETLERAWEDRNGEAIQLQIFGFYCLTYLHSFTTQGNHELKIQNKDAMFNYENNTCAG